jgi:hypothetical protein
MAWVGDCSTDGMHGYKNQASLVGGNFFVLRLHFLLLYLFFPGLSWRTGLGFGLFLIFSLQL